MRRLIITSLFFVSQLAFAQTNSKLNNRVDLDDVSIKGEANKGSVSFSNRSRHSLNDRIKLRKDFNKEITDNLPEDFIPAKSNKSN